MSTLLQRLYRTKLALIATIFTTGGIAILFAAQWNGPGWWNNLPVADIGSALFTTGLIAIVFEFFDSHDADERARHRIRAAIAEQAPAIRDAVIEGFETHPERLTRIASPHALDRIIGNCLAARINDAELASEMYEGIQSQIANDGDIRRYDAHVTITLNPWEHGPASGLGSMFVATTRWQYRANTLPAVLRFSAVSDNDEYRNLVRDPASIETWLFEPTTGLTITDPDTYQLIHCSINGRAQTIDHQTTENAQLYTASIGDTPTSGAHVSYTHRTLVTQHGHLLFIDFATTKGLRVDFTYTPSCGIRHVSVLDYVNSHTRPRIERSPQGVPSPMISVDFGDTWTWPRSGVAFTWVLDREVVPQTQSS